MPRPIFFGLLFALAIFILVAGCTKSTEPEKPATLYEGTLTVAVITKDENGKPIGMADIPIRVELHYQVDPGPLYLDTAYTNEYGIALFKQRVHCWTYDPAGKLTITTPDETRIVYFNNEEMIDVIFTVP